MGRSNDDDDGKWGKYKSAFSKDTASGLKRRKEAGESLINSGVGILTKRAGAGAVQEGSQEAAQEMGQKLGEKLRTFKGVKQPMKRVEVPIKQKGDGTYEAKPIAPPSHMHKMTKTIGVKKIDPRTVPKVDLQVDHYILKDKKKWE